ncbi:GOLPH3/VPS74 family protein [Nocardioides nanhaiensis]|uniref:GPP34 family phosphoprotein n=1 Tax=Nocardioides nanhaiensis TaxID=1476871 RepID=A0ABP8W164_9ACTN
MLTLLAEDLLLLLLDDEKGTPPSGVQLPAPLGGALLAELAMAGEVEVEPAASRWRRSTVAVTDGAHEDPQLAQALAVVAEKPRSAQDLVTRLGKNLPDTLRERLAERGLLERREGKVLGLFPRTTWPAADVEHERQVRERLTAVLVQGLTPDPRTAALAGLLAAVDQAHKVVERGDVPAKQVKKRAKALGEGSEGEWATKAVRDAIAATTAATTAAITASTAVAVSS